MIAPDSLLLTLAQELTGRPCRHAPQRLARLARQLPPPAIDPLDDLVAIAALMRRELSPDPDGSLLLPEVLATGVGHPAATVVAAAAAARARGMAVAIVGHGARTWLAHERPCDPFVVDPIEPQPLVDARTLGIDLHWRCAHELAGLRALQLSGAPPPRHRRPRTARQTSGG